MENVAPISLSPEYTGSKLLIRCVERSAGRCAARVVQPLQARHRPRTPVIEMFSALPLRTYYHCRVSRVCHDVSALSASADSSLFLVMAQPMA